MDDSEFASTQIINELTVQASETLLEQPIEEGKDALGETRNVWGLLRRKGLSEIDDIKLVHRIDQENRKDIYTIGRNSMCDIVVNDRRVSSSHCKIYCDYSLPKLRVFIEDTSANGTFVNFSLKRLSKGERLELKSGDEIYLLNPRYHGNEMNSDPNAASTFMFFNMRDRLFDQREVLSNNISSNNNCILSKANNSEPHIEDSYIIGDQIGSGTSGQVYLCIHRVTGKNYAVKIIDTTKFTKFAGLSIKELRDEANMMRQLDHPGIIKVQETYETDSAVFIVMELVRGGDLFDRIMLRGRYTEDAAREITKNILSAVKYLHSRNIIHRDLKPENILLATPTNDTDIKISDFGLAKKVSTEGLKTFCGTPFYFAPEVLKRQNTVHGKGRYGTAADMWSIGVILYILLAGAFPFDENHLFYQIQYAQYSLSGPDWNGISDSAKHLIRCLMSLHPETRITVDDALKHPWITNSVLNSSYTGSYQISYSGSQSNHKQTNSKNTLSKRLSNALTLTSSPQPKAITTYQAKPLQAESAVDKSSQLVPVGSIFWSVKLQRPNTTQVNDNHTPQSNLQCKTSSTNQISLFSQVVGNSSVQTNSEPSKDSEILTGKTESKAIERRTDGKSDKTSHKRKLVSSTSNSKVKTVLSNDRNIIRCNIIYTVDGEEKEYKELSDDQIEDYSDEEKSHFEQNPVNINASADEQHVRTKKKPSKSDHSKSTDNRKLKNNQSTSKAVNSLEKAWKLNKTDAVSGINPLLGDQPVGQVASKCTEILSPCKINGSKHQTENINPLESIVGEPSIVKEAGCNFRKPSSSRKLRQPVKSIVELFKKKNKS